MSTRTILTALFATALTMPVVAQENPPHPLTAPAVAVTAPAVAAPVAAETAEPAASNAVSRDKDTLSVDFPDEDLPETVAGEAAPIVSRVMAELGAAGVPTSTWPFPAGTRRPASPGASRRRGPTEPSRRLR